MFGTPAAGAGEVTAPALEGDAIGGGVVAGAAAVAEGDAMDVVAAGGAASGPLGRSAQEDAIAVIAKRRARPTILRSRSV
jgi:hypothetical protein